MTAAEIAASMRAEAHRLHSLAVQLDGIATLLDGDELVLDAPDALDELASDDAPLPREAKRQRTLALRVVSSLHPTERELDGREVAHTTEEPAATAS